MLALWKGGSEIDNMRNGKHWFAKHRFTEKGLHEFEKESNKRRRQCNTLFSPLFILSLIFRSISTFLISFIILYYILSTAF